VAKKGKGNYRGNKRHVMDGNSTSSKRQCVDPPSSWCSPVTATTVAPKWTYIPPPAQQSTPVSSQLPAFNMPTSRANSPPRFFFPDDVIGDSPSDKPPSREEKYMKYRDARFPLAGIMRENGGIFEWMAGRRGRA
jgi:hypothetical protein